MSTELKRKTISAVAWSGADIFVRQVLQFALSVVLARLLAPEEFGLLAMLSLLTAMASLFVDSGFTVSLIQRRELTQEQTSSVFYFNVVIAAAMALGLCAVAPAVAAFYGRPVLRPLTCVMALNVFLSSWGSVQSALLTKALDFRCQMRIGLVSSACGGVAAVLLAWRGWGVWSLAWSTVISTLTSSILLWRWRPWRPGLVFSLSALRSLMRFGSYMFLSAFLDALYTRLYTLVIGKFYSPADLGYYTRADSVQRLPGSMLSGVVQRVALPAFSSASGDMALLRRGLRKANATVMLLNLPLMLGLLMVAGPLVVTVFGDKWAATVPYLRVLCLGGISWPLHVMNLTVLTALGRSDLFFRLEVFKKALGFSCLLVSAGISIMAMAWTSVFLSVVCFFANAHYSGKLLGYSAFRQLRDLLRESLMTGGMCLLVWLAARLFPLSPALLLTLQVLVGAAAYLVLGFLLKPPVFCEVLAQLRTWAARISGQEALQPPATSV